jgi:hypothetical protein
MNRVVMGACLIVSLFGVSGCVEQSPPLPLTSADFAYAIPLTPTPGLAVQTTLLPLAVYRGVLRQDLGDLRVFNGAGRVVPHAIRVLDQAQTQPRAARVVVGQARAGQPGVFDFDLGGPVPVDRVQVLLPQDNTLIQAVLLVRDTPHSPESRVYQGHFYRVVHEGEHVDSAAVAVGRRAHRYWVLRVDGKGGGLGGAVPELNLEYFPEQLLFVARGPAPFRLLFGSHRADVSQFTAGELTALLPEPKRHTLARQTAEPGPSVIESGEAALQSPSPPLPLKTYLLWSVLVASVLLLGVICWRLVRSLETGE